MAKTEIDSKAAEAANEEQVKETETQAEAEGSEGKGSFFGRRTSAGGRKREKRIFLQKEG